MSFYMVHTGKEARATRVTKIYSVKIICCINNVERKNPCTEIQEKPI